MRVLVTGGAGFIGSHIVDALHGAGCDVVVFDAFLSAAHGASAQVPADVVTGDVRDRVAVEEALALYVYLFVCHQAAVVGMGRDFADAPEYVSCNDLGTAVPPGGHGIGGCDQVAVGRFHGRVRRRAVRLFRPRERHACSALSLGPGSRTFRGHLSALFADSVARFGLRRRGGRPAESLRGDQSRQEHLVSSWARAVGGVATSLRYHNVYGPRMPKDTPYAGVASFFRSALSSGTAPQVFEDGRQRRDFVHVRDIADANVVAAQALDDRDPGSLRAYNVASGQPHTIGQMADTLAKAYGGPPPVVTGRYRLGDVRHITASIDRIGRELGWSPKIEFAEGMTEFAAAPLRAG